MNDVGVTGMTVTQVMGCGIQKGAGERYRGAEVDATLLPKVKVEVIVGNIPVENIIEAANAARFSSPVRILITLSTLYTKILPSPI